MSLGKIVLLSPPVCPLWSLGYYSDVGDMWAWERGSRGEGGLVVVVVAVVIAMVQVFHTKENSSVFLNIDVISTISNFGASVSICSDTRAPMLL